MLFAKSLLIQPLQQRSAVFVLLSPRLAWGALGLEIAILRGVIPEAQWPSPSDRLQAVCFSSCWYHLINGVGRLMHHPRQKRRHK